jgi:hypothetical protein
VDVDIRLLEHFSRDAEALGARLDERQRRLRTLFHHVTELTREDEPAVPRHSRGLDEQDVAADRSPRETRGNARDAAAHRDFGLELARTENSREVVPGDGRVLRVAVRNAHGHVAEHVADLPFEIAHAGFARVVVDDRHQHVVADGHLLGGQPRRLELALDQVPPRDLQLLL